MRFAGKDNQTTRSTDHLVANFVKFTQKIRFFRKSNLTLQWKPSCTCLP